MSGTTIRDVARIAQVSIATVSNYLNDTKPVSEAVRLRIDEAVKRLDFVPNRASQVMRGAKSRLIGLIIPDMGNPFYTELARGVEDAARDAGHMVIMCNTDGDSSRERMYLRALHEMRATGVLVSLSQSSHDQVQTLRRNGVAVVLLDHRRDYTDISAVTSDDLLGGELAMAHLIEIGHRDILFIGGPAGERPVDDRFVGAQRALISAGLPPSLLHRIDTKGSSIAERVEVANQVLALPALPDAVFCANDTIAITVQATLAHHGIIAPRDIGLVGYDDLDSARLAPVPLTSVSQPKYQQGFDAARLLFAEAESSAPEWKEIIYAPELIVRESTVAGASLVSLKLV